MSERDERDRHRGISHHARAVYDLCLGDPRVAWPAGRAAPSWATVEAVDTRGWREACASLPLSHMGRGPDEDPSFFEAAFAAGRLVRRLVRDVDEPNGE
jgi:Protein of unknown function (DUF3866)